MKTKWTKTVPTKDGWYWCSFFGKFGRVYKPCRIMRLTANEVCMETIGFFCVFSSHHKREVVWFGDEIKNPSNGIPKKKKAKKVTK